MKNLTLSICMLLFSLFSYSQWTDIITDATGDTGFHDATLLEYQYNSVTDQVLFRINTVSTAPFAGSPAADFSFQLPFGLDSGTPAGAHWSSTTPVHKTAFIYCDVGGSAPSAYTYTATALQIQETSGGAVLCDGCVSIFTDIAANQITYTFNRTDIITDTEMGGPTATIGLVANLGSGGGWDDAITHSLYATSSATFTITIPEDELTALFTPETATICNSESITFTDVSTSADPGGITGWNWNFDGGTPATASTAGPHTVSYATDGIFNATLEVTDATGTHDTTFTVTVVDCDNLVAAFTPEALNICAGDCIGFSEESTGSLINNWTWTFSDPAITSPILAEDPGSVCFPNAGTQNITLTVTNGFFAADTTIAITVNPAPIIAVTETPIGPHCIGDALTLTSSGASTYTWTDGVVDGINFSPSATTTYTVTGTDDIGCSNTSNITVTMNSCVPIVAEFNIEDNNCLGDCQTLEDLSTGDPISWTWDFGGAVMPNISTEQNPTICLDTPGIYTVQLTVTNAVGEAITSTSSITVNTIPVISTLSDTIIELGGNADLGATSSVSGGIFIWEPDENISCENCAVTTASPISDITYTVTYKDVNGCEGKNSQIVYVNFIEAIGVPDAFSPNGDGNNDVLYVKGFGISAIEFMVYNRYGEQIFSSQTQDIGWDGSFLNRPQTPGTFTWVLRYQLEDGTNRIKKGNVMLIR